LFFLINLQSLFLSVCKFPGIVAANLDMATFARSSHSQFIGATLHIITSSMSSCLLPGMVAEICRKVLEKVGCLRRFFWFPWGVHLRKKKTMHCVSGL
jgi:hypothetical protein